MKKASPLLVPAGLLVALIGGVVTEFDWGLLGVLISSIGLAMMAYYSFYGDESGC